MNKHRGVVFFDLVGTLVAHTPSGFEVRISPAHLLALSAHGRLGVLCNLPRGVEPGDVRMLLRHAGLEGLFEPDLLVFASQLPCPLPDRRAFAAAAAIAEVPAAELVFVTADPALVAPATAAGFRVETPAPAAPAADEGGLLGDVTTPDASEGGLLAGEVDEDTGPTFLLRGRIVTMGAAGVIEDGRIAIRRGKIVAVQRANQPRPNGFAEATEVDTGATLYPGLIDLHNHFVYNILTLWKVPQRFDNRDEWPRRNAYKELVSMPTRRLAGHAAVAKAIVRYVETKALLGGTCTGQGIKTRVAGGIRQFRGAMRNVEQTDDGRLPEANTMVPNLWPAPDRVDVFRRNLQRYRAFFYHLSEGVDDRTRGHFEALQEHDLVARSLIGVHALALRKADHAALAAAGAKIVWSPFSNMLLYGKTLSLKDVVATQVPISLGCDWSPTGSKNLLEELKVARWCADTQDAGLSDEALVRMVTTTPARALGWQDALGTLEAGRLADLVAIEGTGGDPYRHLISARERNVALVVIHGIARYGARDLMTKLKLPGATLEHRTIDGARKSFHLTGNGSGLDDVTVDGAIATLTTAMGDLAGFEALLPDDGGLSSDDGSGGFELVLDMDEHLEAVTAEATVDDGGLLADPVMPASLPLDTLVVDAEHVAAIRAQHNIDAALKTFLEGAYE